MAILRKIKTTSTVPQPVVDDTDRVSMLRWLQWNDPNGCYTDEVCLHERCKCISWAEARTLFLDATKDLTEDDYIPEPHVTYDEQREKAAKEAQSKVADAINHMGLDIDQVARLYMTEHRTGQQTFMRVAWRIIQEFAKQDHWDGRNEATIKLAKFLVNEVEESGINDALPLY